MIRSPIAVAGGVGAGRAPTIPPSMAVGDRGYGLCPRAIRLELSQMFFRPATKRVQRFNQGSAQSRERVLHLRRHNGMNDALHQTVALEAAQRLGQHFLRNAPDLAL